MIGQTISRFRIAEIIGKGAMGIVFKAQDTASGQFVALKILAEKLAEDPDILHRFEREGGAASALKHPNICTVFEAGNWQGRPYLAMELLTGQPLDERLASGPLPPRLLVEIAIGVLSALEAVHALGVIHRDIKPATLFLTTTGQVKILDFGLAKLRLPSAPIGDDAPTIAVHLTARFTLVGTPAYMSPEQVCCEPLDGRSDLYSLGVTLYELASGQLPARASPNPDALPAVLAPMILKLMATDPRSRYQTAREAHEDFQRLMRLARAPA
jgi:serine/threonine protein kinase